MFVYLDNSATTKPSKEAIAAVREAMESDWGNPSSLYRLGLSAEKLMKAARENTARSMGCRPEEVFFTSCGSESDNWVLSSVWESRKKQGKRIITSAVEHPAIIKTCEKLKALGAEVVFVKPDSDGKIRAEKVAEALTPDTILVSIMHVNNETGAVMPLPEIRRAIDASGCKALFHTDAVQSYGKLECNVNKLGVDFLSVSGHKVHALKGVGALYIRSGVNISPFICGGGQERGMRSGTENIPGIVSMGAAAKHISEHLEEDRLCLEALRARMAEHIANEIPDIKINSPEGASPSVLNVSFLGCRSEVLLHMLDAEGVCVSAGSACSSHSRENRVLSAMGLSKEEMQGVLRFSFSHFNTMEEIDYAAGKLRDAVNSHRKLMRLHKR